MPPIVRVSIWHLRRIFNRERYWAKIEAGELHCAEREIKTPRPESKQLPGTESYEEVYEDGDGNVIVKTHQYVLNGTRLGRLDPKKLLFNGKIYCRWNWDWGNGMGNKLRWVLEWYLGLHYKLARETWLID